ncbi:hypothetical protein [Cobetia crustatorum]|uniref:Tape measure protein n=1 Tax=Cobetia crustatorum TaxID=553385 RepID=A0A558HDS0_9GAMM|nr:hypothetical protein [Cobetia crustatorum]TVU67207.1 hypothetical protein FQP86_17345 [Cobetia crustatorum]
MALSDLAVELVLKAKNLISPSTDDAADSVSALSAEAAALRESLDQLEDQRALVRAFQQAGTATEKAQKEWDKAREKLSLLEQELEGSGEASVAQQNRLNEARAVAARAGDAYAEQAAQAAQLGQSLTDAGIDTGNLSQEQLRLASEARAAQNALDQVGAAAAEAGDQVEEGAGGFARARTALVNWGAAAAGAAIAGAGLVAGFATRFTSEQAALAKELDNVSRRTGVNIEALQKYRYAFQRAGLDADEAGDIFQDVADKIGDAYENGGGEAMDALEGLGIAAKDLISLSPDEMLLRLADAMKDLPQASQINFLEGLASNASRLQPLLTDNAAGLKALGEQARELGLIMSPEQIENLLETNAAISRLQGRVQGLANQMLGKLAPAVSDLATSFDEIVKDNPRLIDDLATAISGVIKVGSDWARSFVENRKQIGEAMESLADTSKFMGNSLVSVFRAVQAAATGLTAGLASTASMVLDLNLLSLKALRSVGAASDKEVARAQAKAEAAQATLDDLNQQAAKYARQALEAGKAAFSAYDDADASATKAAAAEKHAEALGLTADQLDALGEGADVAGGKLVSLEEKQKRQAQASKLQAKAAANAAETLGTSLSELATGISDSEADAIDAFGRLAKGGQLTAEQLSAAFKKSRDEIESDKGLAAFSAQLDELVASGVAGADLLQANLKASGEKAADALGLSLQDLTTGISKAEAEIIDSFDTLARQGDLTGKQLKTALGEALTQLDGQEAFAAIRETLTGLVTDGVTGAGALRSVWSEYKASIDDTTTALEEQRAQDAATQAEAIKNLRVIQNARQAAQAEDEAATQSAISNVAARASVIGGGLAAVYNKAANATQALSAQAGSAFKAAMTGTGGVTGTVDLLRDKIADLEESVGNAFKAWKTRADPMGVNKYLAKVAANSGAVELEFRKQQLAATELQETLAKVSDSDPGASLRSLAADSGQAISATNLLRMSSEELRQQFDLLDDASLSSLESAIQSVRSQVDSLSDSVSDTLSSLRSELASLQGDSSQVEALRYQQQQLELQETLNKARALGDAQTISQAQESLRLAEQAHDLRLADIQTQSEQQRQQALETEADLQRQVQAGEATQRENNRDAQARTTQLTTSLQAQRRVAVDLNIGGQQVTLNGVDESEADTFLDTLSRASRTAAR